MPEQPVQTESGAEDGGAADAEGEVCGSDSRSSSSSRVNLASLRSVSRCKELEERHWAQDWEVEIRESLVELVGRRGRTLAWDATARRFRVALEGGGADGAEFLLGEESLLFSWNQRPEKDGDPEASASGSARSVSTLLASSSSPGENAGREDPLPAGELSRTAKALEAVRAKLFAPGSFFSGTIEIPGMAEHFDGKDQRAEYTLEIVSDDTDELGQQTLLVRHAAYHDEQACHLTLAAVGNTVHEIGYERAPTIQVAYSDEETYCEGILEVQELEAGRCSIRGQVRQLAQGEEGFFERSAVTHFFELTRSTATEAEAHYAVRLEEARRARLEELSSTLLRQQAEREPGAAAEREPQLHVQGWQEIPWRGVIFRDASRVCEERCATLRRQSSLLDSQVFETRERKKLLMKRLQDAGISRSACHAANDESILFLTTLCTAAGGSPEMQAMSRDVRGVIMRAYNRIITGYARLDQSLSSAEARLPLSVISAWSQRVPEAEHEQCVVCFLPLKDGPETCIRLPCGHWFHSDCVRRWLHVKTTCPSCRCDHARPSEDSPREEST